LHADIIATSEDLWKRSEYILFLKDSAAFSKGGFFCKMSYISFMKRIYLDYASLTPIDPRVIREVKKYSGAKYANPSSLYKEGVAAKKAMEEGRKKVADFLHAHSDEIVFTSGGTEANNLAIDGALKAAYTNGIEKPHLIISVIEHSSIMETANILEKLGVEVTRLSVNSSGIISLDELKKAIKPNTFMVSIMMVNNEVGSIQPICEAVKIVRHARKAKAADATDSMYPLFHTDAAQALYEDLNLESLGVDLMTLDGSKVYGPRGIGCLFVRRGTPIEPIIYGGGQERGMMSGTENLPAIMGFAKALELVGAEMLDSGTGYLGTEHFTKVKWNVSNMRALLVEKFKEIRPDIVINGGEDMSLAPPLKSVKKVDTFADIGKDSVAVAGRMKNAAAETSPHILNVSIPGIDNEFFVLQLDAKGIACSTKSSCLRDADESYVLKAMGADLTGDRHGSKTSIRFSFGRWTKKGDIDKAAKIIAGILHQG
jgi:cysteine desulfurase